ncbi:hypothetical protein FOVG_17664 [Fusarium oxysporum f. sp. pisi HDV247]|uniref:Uncharacterized protein n=1 Tax=Fusarium oxysporum f. sp. pisi HDV247 TaxID=1080344 RepID=W9NJW0_FUSOX|nr:hypothetical protein FOVG_17664 [Fusarium oxysporum f. sp. pisi HDV247]
MEQPQAAHRAVLVCGSRRALAQKSAELSALNDTDLAPSPSHEQEHITESVVGG